jgi:hypothetical protein
MKYLFLIAVLMLAGCSSHDDAVKALTEAGYTNIETHGHAWFACGKDDSFATSFTAIGPTGQKVSGSVCSGWLKGKTIRTD